MIFPKINQRHKALLLLWLLLTLTALGSSFLLYFSNQSQSSIIISDRDNLLPSHLQMPDIKLTDRENLQGSNAIENTEHLFLKKQRNQKISNTQHGEQEQHINIDDTDEENMINDYQNNMGSRTEQIGKHVSTSSIPTTLLHYKQHSNFDKIIEKNSFSTISDDFDDVDNGSGSGDYDSKLDFHTSVHFRRFHMKIFRKFENISNENLKNHTRKSYTRDFTNFKLMNSTQPTQYEVNAANKQKLIENNKLQATTVVSNRNRPSFQRWKLNEKRQEQEHISLLTASKETQAKRLIGNEKKSEERSHQILLCEKEKAGGGELCRMLFKEHVYD